MIRCMYYVLCKNGIVPALGDYENKRWNLIIQASKSVYLSFDGYVPSDVEHAYVIHATDEAPNEVYLDYYAQEVSLQEAFRILDDIFTDCGIEAVLEPVEAIEEDVTAYYDEAVQNQNEQYLSMIRAYLSSEEKEFYPPTLLDGCYLKNWFEMQENHYFVTYTYNGRKVFVVYDDSAWGDWGYYYSACSKWLAVNNADDIPQCAQIGEMSLSPWVTEQRTAYREGYLSSEREQFLRNIGFSFNTYDDAWEDKLKLLMKYKAEFGSTNIEKRASYKGEALGRWCIKQRDDNRNGKLTEERRQKLLALGFDFDPLETEWNRRFEQYKRYIEQTGQYYISRRTDFEGEHLGAWVETQRKWNRNGKMSEKRKNMLLSINPELFSGE